MARCNLTPLPFYPTRPPSPPTSLLLFPPFLLPLPLTHILILPLTRILLPLTRILTRILLPLTRIRILPLTRILTLLLLRLFLTFPRATTPPRAFSHPPTQQLLGQPRSQATAAVGAVGRRQLGTTIGGQRRGVTGTVGAMVCLVTGALALAMA